MHSAWYLANVTLYVVRSLEVTSGACDCRRAGYEAFLQRQQQRGADFAQAARQKSYQLAPRATLFRRDAGTVDDLASLKHLMRSNSFSTDPVSPFDSTMLSQTDPEAHLATTRGMPQFLRNVQGTPPIVTLAI